MLAILISLVTLLTQVRGAETERFETPLVVTFEDTYGSQRLQYFWADHTRYKDVQEKNDLSFERDQHKDDVREFNTLTFNSKVNNDARIIYVDTYPLGPNGLAYRCEVYVDDTPPYDKISWDMTAPPFPGKEHSGSNVVRFDCDKEKTKVGQPPVIPEKPTPSPVDTSTRGPVFSASVTTAPTDPSVSSAVSEKAVAPLAHLDSSPFDTPIIVSFLVLNSNSNTEAGWVDTTVYGYDEDGKTDKIPQDQKKLDNAAPNGEITQGYLALGQMKFTNTPQEGRSYSWQPDISQPNYINCNFTIKHDLKLPKLLVWLNEDDRDSISLIAGKTDSGLPANAVNDATIKKMNEDISVSCKAFGG